MPAAKTPTAGEATSGFEIACACGAEHRGRRRRRHQQIICNDCGTALFVLPADAYPPPPTGKKPAGPGALGRLGGALGLSVGRASQRSAEVSRRAKAKAVNAAAAVGRAAKWLFTPLKLAAMLLAVLIGGTVTHLARTAALEEAERVARVASVRGLELLRGGDYEAARESLAEAAAALDQTGERSADERRVRQALRETTALTRPATGSLLDLLDEVAAAGVNPDGSWKRGQQTGYADSWIVLDAMVTRSKGRTRIALPIRVGEDAKPVRVRADVRVLESAPLTAEPTAVTLAAKVRGVTEYEKGWDIELDPDASFLWETAGLYPALGFTFDPLTNPQEAVLDRLARQARWQGAEPGEPPLDAPPEGESPAEDAELPDARPEAAA